MVLSLHFLSAPCAQNTVLPAPGTSLLLSPKSLSPFARLFPAFSSEGNLNISYSRKPSMTAMMGQHLLRAPLLSWAHPLRDLSEIIVTWLVCLPERSLRQRPPLAPRSPPLLLSCLIPHSGSSQEGMALGSGCDSVADSAKHIHTLALSAAPQALRVISARLTSGVTEWDPLVQWKGTERRASSAPS